MSPTSDEKLDFKRILPIFIIVLVDLLGLTIIIPLLPLYAAAFGANAFVIGLLGATFPIMQLIGSPLLGGWSDRLGRKPVLIVSQIGTFIGFILLGLAGSLPLLFISRLIDGFTGGNIVVAQAAMTDSTTERTRAQGLGLIGAAFGIGFTLGPAIAGITLVATNNNFTVPAFIAAGFSLLSIILTAVWFKETLPAPKAASSGSTAKADSIVQRILNALQNPLIGMLLVLVFFQQLVFGGLEQLLPVFTLSRLGMDGAGNAALFLLVGLVIVMVQGKYIGPLSRKYGERRLIYAGLGLLALGMLLTAITPEVPVPWYERETILEEAAADSSTDIAVPLPDEANKGWLGFAWIAVSLLPATVGSGLLSPSLNSLITRRVSASSAGSALGVSSSLISAANAIAPLIGGAIFQVLGSTAPFLIGGLLCIGLVALALRRIQPGPEEVAPVSAAQAP